jgi:hypothetical protein
MAYTRLGLQLVATADDPRLKLRNPSRSVMLLPLRRVALVLPVSCTLLHICPLVL